MPAHRITRETSRRRRMLAGLAAVAVVAAAALPEAARAGRGMEAATDVRAVFEQVRTAWEREDQQALAALVHHDGLRVLTPGTSDRASTYSPSQAFYYFKNLFQSHDTDAFLYQRIQDTVSGPRVHALVQWHRHRAGTHREETVRLMFVLARQGDGWGLAEITTIR